MAPSAPQELPSPDDLSYPPDLFIPSANRRGRGTPAAPATSPRHGGGVRVPELDLRRLDRAGLVDACKRWGLFRLANHGVPSALSAELHARARVLFSLPFESKKAHFSLPNVSSSSSSSSYFWGTPAPPLHLREVNWIEGLHFTLGHHPSPCTTTNPESSAFHGFRHLMDVYGEHMARVARMLFDALAAELELDGARSAAYLSEFDGSTLRAYRYPKCPDEARRLGMEAHTDSSVLSILNADDVEGLQILRDGRWCDVEPVAGTLIVNLGDMMQAISDDEWKSVQHRVVANGSKERISICYFTFPAEDAVIISSTYRPFTYKEFKRQVKEDIDATGSKVGLSRFKLIKA